MKWEGSSNANCLNAKMIKYESNFLERIFVVPIWGFLNYKSRRKDMCHVRSTLNWTTALAVTKPHTGASDKESRQKPSVNKDKSLVCLLQKTVTYQADMLETSQETFIFWTQYGNRGVQFKQQYTAQSREAFHQENSSPRGSEFNSSNTIEKLQGLLSSLEETDLAQWGCFPNLSVLVSLEMFRSLWAFIPVLLTTWPILQINFLLILHFLRFQIEVADRTLDAVDGQGSISLTPTLPLNSVFHVPKLSVNLWSISQNYQKTQFQCTFFSCHCLF